MNIKELREKTNLSQKDFGERIGLKYQTVLLYEKGKNVPETVEKLIRYEFAKYLPEEERLVAESSTPYPDYEEEKRQEIQELKEENTRLKDDLREIPHLKEQNSLLKRTVELLEDQVQLYKDRLDMTNGTSKPA